MDPLSPLAIVAAVALVALALRWLSRPHTVIRIERGRVALVRGRPPSGLLAELARVAELSETAAGRIEIGGRGSRLDVRTPGLDDPTAQRVRNAVFLDRDRIG
jgi:hypothetical protein